MVIANIKNNTVRRFLVAALTPVALIIYAAFGASLYVVDYFMADIKDAWKGPQP